MHLEFVLRTLHGQCKTRRCPSVALLLIVLGLGAHDTSTRLLLMLVGSVIGGVFGCPRDCRKSVRLVSMYVLLLRCVLVVPRPRRAQAQRTAVPARGRGLIIASAHVSSVPAVIAVPAVQLRSPWRNKRQVRTYSDRATLQQRKRQVTYGLTSGLQGTTRCVQVVVGWVVGSLGRWAS